jgi:hypothetical protein
MRPTYLFAALFLAVAPLAFSHADLPGRHPAYLHALADLRTARWILEPRAGDAGVSERLDAAEREIEAAIREIKEAAIDDGKDIKEHVAIDLPIDPAGRYGKAIELLRQTRNDVDHAEDDPLVRQLKHRALEHIDRALEQVDIAIREREREHRR